MKSLSTGYGGGEASGRTEKGWREGGGGRGRGVQRAGKENSGGTMGMRREGEEEKENMGKRRMRGEGRGGEKMGIGRIWDNRERNNKLQIGLIFLQRVSNEVHVPPSH